MSGQRRAEQRDRRRRTSWRGRRAGRARTRRPSRARPPAPTAAPRTPTPAIARVEQVERDHDGEHGEAAARERLATPSPVISRSRGSAAMVREPAQHGRDPRRARPSHAAGRRTGAATTTRPAEQRRGGAHREDRRPARSVARRTAASAGPPSVASESSMPRTGVRARELERGLRQRRAAAPSAPAVEGHGDRGDDRAGRRSPPPARRRPSPPRRRPASTPRTTPTHEQHPLPADPVGHRREERGEQRGRRPCGPR